MLPFLHIAAADAGVKVENVFVAIGASRPEINVDNIPDDAIIIGTHQLPTSQVAAFISFLLRPAIKFSPTILSHVGAMISMQCAIAASCVPSHVSFFLACFIVSKCRSHPFRCHLMQSWMVGVVRRQLANYIYYFRYSPTTVSTCVVVAIGAYQTACEISAFSVSLYLNTLIYYPFSFNDIKRDTWCTKAKYNDHNRHRVNVEFIINRRR